MAVQQAQPVVPKAPGGTSRAWGIPLGANASVRERGKSIVGRLHERHVFLGVLLVLAFLAALATTALGSTPTSSALNVAAVTLLATTAAVIIERLLELLWTLVGLTKGSFWPLNQVDAQAEEIVKDLNAALDGYQKQAQGAVEALQKIGKLSKPVADEAKKEIAQLKKAADDLNAAARDKGQIGAFASAAAQHLGYLDTKYGLLLSAAQKAHLDIADPAIEDAIGQARADERARVKQPPPVGVGADDAEADRLADIVAAAKAKTLYVARVETLLGQGSANEAQRKQALADFADRRKTAREAAKGDAQQAGKPADEVEAAGDLAEADVARQYIFADDATETGTKLNVAIKALGGLTDFVASFKDNPGRRLLSLTLACTLGLVTAGLFKLDVFSAILAPNGSTAPSEALLTHVPPFLFFPATQAALHVGVMLTGLLLGLGSAPTHEVIRVLQEYKESQKRDNAPEVDLPNAATGSNVPTIR